MLIFIKTAFTKYNVIFLFQIILTIFFLAELSLVNYFPLVSCEVAPFYLLLAIMGLFLLQFTLFRLQLLPEDQVFPYSRLKDKNYLIIIVIFLIFCYLFHAYGGAKFFTFDDKKYYAYVKSFVIDGDFDFLNDYQQLRVEDPYHLHLRTKAGRPPNIYPPGSMALWLPFYFLIHILLKIIRLFDPGLLTDGLIQPYRNSVGLATIFYACLACLIIYRMLKDYVKKSLAITSVLMFILSAFLIYYIIFSPLMPTVCEAFIATLFIFLWLKWRKGGNFYRHLLLGSAGGLSIFIRPTLGIFLLLPAIDIMSGFVASLRHKNWGAIKRECFLSVALLIGIAVGAMPLLLVWKAVYGEWIVSFSRYYPWLSSPFILQVLFSWRHGLISWSPITLFCLLGLIFLTIKHKEIGLSFIAIFLMILYINASQKDWWGGGSFGARRFASLTPIFCFGLAFFLQRIKNKIGKKLLIPVLIFFCCLIIWNLLLLYQFERNLINSSDSTHPITLLNNNKSILLQRLPETAKLTGYWIKGLSLGISANQYHKLKSSSSFTGDFLIDIAGEDEPFIGKNWGIKDHQGDISFRWSLRGLSTLLFSLKKTASYHLFIHCWPYTYPSSPPQSITLRINGHRLPAIPLQNKPKRYNILIPKKYFKKGINQIKIFSAYSIRPSYFIPNLDPRKISVSFDYFSFISAD